MNDQFRRSKLRKLPLPLRIAWWTVTLQLPARMRLRGEKRFLLASGLFETDFYMRQIPDVERAGMDPLEHYLLVGWATHNPHPLFDTSWYLAQNPDVARAGVNPVLHYLQSGGFEERDPHPLFNSAFYLEQNPEVAAARLNPLAHYVNRGWKERRNPHPFFDIDFYLKRYPDVLQTGAEPLKHYIVCGGSEKRDPHPIFDTHFYLEQNPEVTRSGINPLVHFLRHGGNPNRYFDVAFYLEQNTDLPKTAVEAVQHYLRQGASENRNPHPLFDAVWYLEKNPEVAKSGENPLLHFLQTGRRKCRDPHPLFDSAFYLEQRPDTIAADIPPSDHYLHSGGMEGFDPHPLFDSDWYLAQSPDAASAGENPLVHYLYKGWRQRRSPSAVFDEAFYLEQSPNVAEGAISSLHHYLIYGAAQGRNPNRWFDTNWYVSQNPEIVAAGWNPLIHYVRIGAREGRRPRPQAITTQALPAARRQRPRVVFVSGEPEIPGHRYRVLNIASSLAPRFFETVIMSCSEVPDRISEITEADVVWIWRARLSPKTAVLTTALLDTKVAMIFDVDDLMFRPELATTKVIDGIRTQNLSEASVRAFYTDVRLLLLKADRCTAPTIPLVREMRDFHKAATVIPNGFDRGTFERTRSAMRARRAAPEDGLLRIGYAAGSRTHQRDLATASRAIAAVLSDHPNARLVLFRRTVILEEFPELEAVQDQVEWRDLVPMEELPSEYARFDINIAPLEVGNRFCEAKSELKFFEAALVGVPTLASPTRPFADVIRHGENGLLATDYDQWYAGLTQLLFDSGLRRRMADQAYHDALWLYGPERRSLLVTRLVNEILAEGPLRSEIFRSEMQTDSIATIPSPAVPEYDILFQSPHTASSRVSVVVPLFNYGHFLEEALESVLQQTLRDVDLIVVDDRSTDNSLEVARRWLEEHAGRFNMVALLQNRQNSKLGRARNAAIHFSDTELFMPLDADNALLPDCLEKCMALLDETGAAFAYPTVSLFGDRNGQIGLLEYDPALLQCANYIDAMAMVRKACWIAVGGYSPLEPAGWEDYEFWCKLAEKGLFGVRVPETTARYRTHGASMLRALTDVRENKLRVIEDMNRRHPWLQLSISASDERASENMAANDKQ